MVCSETVSESPTVFIGFHLALKPPETCPSQKQEHLSGTCEVGQIFVSLGIEDYLGFFWELVWPGSQRGKGALTLHSSLCTEHVVEVH